MGSEKYTASYQAARMLYQSGRSGRIDPDHGFIGRLTKPILATAGELVRYQPEYANGPMLYRIVRFTSERVVIESRRVRRRTVSPHRLEISSCQKKRR